jgi:hypothetical protein
MKSNSEADCKQKKVTIIILPRHKKYKRVKKGSLFAFCVWRYFTTRRRSSHHKKGRA